MSSGFSTDESLTSASTARVDMASQTAVLKVMNKVRLFRLPSQTVKSDE